MIFLDLIDQTSKIQGSYYWYSGYNPLHRKSSYSPIKNILAIPF